MIDIRSSNATSPNPDFKELSRQEGESNSQWLARALADTNVPGTIVLLGGCDLTHFRLRVSQSHARRDLLPSFWSHIALLRNTRKNDWPIYQISLDPPNGFGAVAFRNGVQEASLRQYDSPQQFPNIACIQLSVAAGSLPEGQTLPAVIERAVESFQKQRSLVDLGTHLVDWLGYVWGVSGSSNPLLKGSGIPSAVFVESVFAIAGIDLTPGVASNLSCPEAIWQAAKWWHEFYASEATITQAPPKGNYIIGQRSASIAETSPVAAAAPSKSRRSK